MVPLLVCSVWDFPAATGAEIPLTSQKLARTGLSGYLVACSDGGLTHRISWY